MAIFYTIPVWFSGYDIIFELVFALITALVAAYSFRVYSLSNQRESKIFGIGFSLISLSYLLWAALNFSIFSEIKEGITNGISIVELQNLSTINYLSAYSHVFLFLLGLATLVYMSLKVDSIRIYLLLSALTIVSVLGVFETVFSFYLPAAILTIFILIYYLNVYSENHNPKTLFVLIGFTFLLFSLIDFILIKDQHVQYVISHLLVFLAYIFILMSLIIVIRGNKKRKKVRLR